MNTLGVKDKNPYKKVTPDKVLVDISHPGFIAKQIELEARKEMKLNWKLGSQEANEA